MSPAQHAEQAPHLGERLAAGLLDQRSGSSARSGSWSRSSLAAPFDGHDADRVGDDVVQLAGDPRPLLGHGGEHWASRSRSSRTVRSRSSSVRSSRPRSTWPGDRGGAEEQRDEEDVDPRQTIRCSTGSRRRARKGRRSPRPRAAGRCVLPRLHDARRPPRSERSFVDRGRNEERGDRDDRRRRRADREREALAPEKRQAPEESQHDEGRLRALDVPRPDDDLLRDRDGQDQEVACVVAKQRPEPSHAVKVAPGAGGRVRPGACLRTT